MINFENIETSEPYIKFQELYNQAVEENQEEIQAISISSLNKQTNEVESRFVNLKYIINNEWIFFSNYKSVKASNFKEHDQISALFFWAKINVQIRIKATIKKTDSHFSDLHYSNRSIKKNALAVSSMQSRVIDSYEMVKDNYKKALMENKTLQNRPKYWGGYSFYPYYFEFWNGHKSRLNKRECFHLNDGAWIPFMIQP